MGLLLSRVSLYDGGCPPLTKTWCREWSGEARGWSGAFVSTSVHRRVVHLTTRGPLYCSLARAASVPMLCGRIEYDCRKKGKWPLLGVTDRPSLFPAAPDVPREVCASEGRSRAAGNSEGLSVTPSRGHLPFLRQSYSIRPHNIGTLAARASEQYRGPRVVKCTTLLWTEVDTKAPLQPRASPLHSLHQVLVKGGQPPSYNDTRDNKSPILTR